MPFSFLLRGNKNTLNASMKKKPIGEKGGERMEIITSDTFILGVVGAIFASSGFWAFALYVFQSRQKLREHDRDILACLKGLMNIRIRLQAEEYIARGSITNAEYRELIEYLYKPYKAIGGNGLAEKMVREVEELPITSRKE